MEFIYPGTKTREISFSLGRIGARSTGLGDHNRPKKGSLNGSDHFVIRAMLTLDAAAPTGDMIGSGAVRR